MTSYEELSTPGEMHADCEAVHRRLQEAAAKAVRPAPSIHYDEQPTEVRKPGIEISEAAQALANALHLHLD